MTEPFKIDLYDEKGKLKSKEAFLKDMENLYGQLGGKKDDMTFMDLFTNPESAFSPDDVLDKYQFIERKLYVDAEINPEMSQYILERIQFWNAEDEFDETPIEERIPIQVYINSPGGCLVSTLQIVDAIRNSKSPVYTIATGAAYSGGFFILLAGHKKMAYPNASFLFHEGSTTISGNSDRVDQNHKFYVYQRKQLRNLVLSTTKIDKKLYETQKDKDWWFDVKKALELGVIDETCGDVNGGIYKDEDNED